MADNTTLNPGVGGDVIATDDIAGVKYQWVKQAFGGNGAVVPVENAPDASLPVQLGIGKAVTGSLNGVGQVLTIELNGAPTVLMNFVNTAYSGTILSEGSIDGGVTFNTCLTWQIGAIANVGGSQVASNAGLSMANVSGMTHFRLRCSAFTSGTLVGTLRSGTSPIAMSILNGAIGQVVPGVSPTMLGKAEDAVHTSGDTGVFILGVRSDSEITQTSNNGDYGPIATDIAGRLIVTLKPTGFPSGTTHNALSVASVNATNLKAASGNVYVLAVSNLIGTIRYLKLFNKASAPTVGTDVPVAVIPLPPSVVTVVPIATPLAFSIGIGYALTNLPGDLDATAVAAGDVRVLIGFA